MDLLELPTREWNAITSKENVDQHPSELPEDEILTRFTLEQVGESYVVDDQKVAHFVEGVGLEDIEQWGHRTIAHTFTHSAS